MKEFNVGEEVKVVEITLAYAGNLKVGDTAIIKKFQMNKNRFVMLVGDDSNLCCWHDINNIELVKPKWTIYNNEKAWQDLSDKQKGKLLLAAHAKMLFYGFGIELPSFKYSNVVYKVEELTKPEKKKSLGMGELFTIDWFDGGQNSDYMIAKGWAKSCK